MRRILWTGLLGCAATCGLLMSPMVHAESVAAAFRGCDVQGWCRFLIEAPDATARTMYRVRPDGVRFAPGNEALSIALRNRLNALLADMIHQAKRIELQHPRALDDGSHAAAILVNGVDIAQDEQLLELQAKQR